MFNFIKICLLFFLPCLIFSCSKNSNNATEPENSNSKEFWEETSLKQPTYMIRINSKGTIFCYVSFQKLFRSTDNGLNWKLIKDNWFFYDIYIDNMDRIYVVDNQVLYKSSDDGENWSASNLSGSIYSLDIRHVFKDNNNLFIGTTDGLYKSTDDGNNWKGVIINNNMRTGWVEAINKNKLNGDLYVCLGGGYLSLSGFYISHDNGNTWNRYFQGTPSGIYIQPNGNLYLTTTGIVYRSTNNGNNWTDVADPTINDLILGIVFFSNNDVFLAANSCGVYHSSNNGSTWTKLQYNSKDLYAQCIAINSSNYVFVGTGGFDGKLYKSNRPVN